MKKFDNQADSNNEKALRRGYNVPDGAVNLAWAKSPSLSPKNNIVIIDTSKSISENVSDEVMPTRLAFSNAQGVLEDINGNEIWEEEFPVIGDLFDDSIASTETDEIDYSASKALQYTHVSRYFHLDSSDMTNGRLKFVDLKDIKVTDNLGNDFVDKNGVKRYRVALIDPIPAPDLGRSDNGIYRVHVFLDIDDLEKELFLYYNKVNLNRRGILSENVIGYKERVNPQPYFEYVPAPSTVVDRANERKKIYTSEPIDVKDQLIGSGVSSYSGWKYYVPRKAIPDPRIFQVFNWRVACEIIKNTAGEDADTGTARRPIVKAGVLVIGDGTYLNTRASFLFYQLNNTGFNYNKVKFVNPLKDETLNASNRDQQDASYWLVNLKTVTPADLAKFDVLVFAPSSNSVDISRYLPKINHFVDNSGGTLIIETSGRCDISNIPGITLTSGSNTIWADSNSDRNVELNTTRAFDATPYNLTDTFSTFGMWKSWPPNVVDIVNNYSDIGSILVSANNISGWDLTTAEKQQYSPYEGLESYREDGKKSRSQYISSMGPNFSTVLEAKASGTSNYKAILAHKKFNSGGNIFVSTSGLFEDHIFDVNGRLATRTIQLSNLNKLSLDNFVEFNSMISSSIVKTEMKFRLNVMMFSTLGKPIQVRDDGELVNDGETVSSTIYSDWAPAWVINPEDDVLTDREKEKFNFSLLPVDNENTNPKWQRILSGSTLEQIIKKKIESMPSSTRKRLLTSFGTSNKRYFILVTNPLVQTRTSPNLDGDSVPTVWTDALSPAFEVPYHLGQYVIRDEMTSSSGAGSGKKIHPPKSYQLQVVADAIETSTSQGKVNALVSVKGKYKATVMTPEYTTTEVIKIPGTDPVTIDITLNWKDNGKAKVYAGYKHQSTGFERYSTIDTYSDANYSTSVPTNWPYMGVWGTLSSGRGSSGEAVLLVQKLLNQLIFFDQISGPYLLEDSRYGSTTASKVRSFQSLRGAKYIDGIVDAETWSLIGYTLLALDTYPGLTDTLLKKYANKAKNWMRISRMSDLDDDSAYVRHTWASNYKRSNTEQSYYIKFDDTYKIYKVSIKPWLYGLSSDTLNINWLDVGKDISIKGYTESSGSPGALTGKSGRDNQWIHIPIKSKEANSIIFTAEQTSLAGWGGTTKVIGIRDVVAHAKKYKPGTAPYTETIKVTHPAQTVRVTRDLSWSGHLMFEAGVPWFLFPSSGLPDGVYTPTGGKTVTTIKQAEWDLDSLSITAYPYNPHNENHLAGIQDFFRAELVDIPSADGDLNKLKLTYMGYQNSVSAANRAEGAVIGSGSTSYYTKDELGNIDQRVKYGWISKEDGLKLICDSEGKPYGFPALPTASSNNYHFTRYRLNSVSSDHTIYYGFYDIKEKEFITNSSGEPEITYYDYIRRNPVNIFIAVRTSYELDGTISRSQANQPIKRPFKWAMPVYHVTTQNKAKIQVEGLSPFLDINEIWSIPIRTGSFTKKIKLRPRSEGLLTNYLRPYQGTSISAYYSVPEASNNAWSSKYGRPYVDIVGEIPVILDSKTIRIRQAPILMKRQPTANPSLADPVIPVFKVYTRESISSNWLEVEAKDIDDYDVLDGTIYLKNAVAGLDPRLVKVDYTSCRNVYNLKHDGSQRINLNPYVNNRPEWFDSPLYVYVLPTHIRSLAKRNSVVTSSNVTNTIKVTSSNAIFDPTQPEYDPTALLIGIIYISTSFDLDDLTILDTRKRGGGISSKYDEANALDIQSEYSSYWDSQTKQNVHYQKGGFVIIRLPQELSNDFNIQEIRSIIEKNITVGVRFKIEDLDGNKWVDE